jgi:hypothetical protein
MPTSTDQARPDRLTQTPSSPEGTAGNRWMDWNPAHDRGFKSPITAMAQTVKADQGIQDTFRPVRIGQDGQRLTGQRDVVIQQQTQSLVRGHDTLDDHGLSDAFFQKATIEVKRSRHVNEWEESSDEEATGDQVAQLQTKTVDDDSDCESDLITF